MVEMDLVKAALHDIEDIRSSGHRESNQVFREFLRSYLRMEEKERCLTSVEKRISAALVRKPRSDVQAWKNSHMNRVIAG